MTRFRELCLAVLAGFFSLSSHSAQAAIIFIGPTGGNWNVTSNWNTGIVPSLSTDWAAINGTGAEVTDTQTVSRLNVGSGTTNDDSYLTITSTGSLTLSTASGQLLRQNWGGSGGGTGGSTINVDGGTLSASTGIQSGNASGLYATLNVTNGGTVTIDNGNLNYTSSNGAARTVVIDGAGSSLTVSGQTLLNGTTPGTLTISNGGTFTTGSGTISGVVSGAGGTFVQDGVGGTTILSGANTFTGNTTVTNGTLKIDGAGTLGGGTYTGIIDVKSGGVFEYASSATQEISGQVTNWNGGGKFLKSGDGVLNLTGASFLVGILEITGGTVNRTGGNINIDAYTISGGTLDHSEANRNMIISGYGSYESTVSGGTTTIAKNLYIATGARSHTLTISNGLISVGNDLFFGHQTGSESTLNLNGGTLAVGNIRQRTTTSTLNLNGGTLQALKDNANFLTATDVDTVSVQSGGVTIDTNNFDITIGKGLTDGGGAGGLTKSGAGTLTLSNAENNTYTGATVVDSGLLVEQVSAAVDGAVWTRTTSATTIEDGATLRLDTTNQSSGNSKQAIGTITVNAGGTLELLTEASAGLQPSIWQNGGASTLIGDGTLVKSGSGRQGIAWTGTSVSNIAQFDGAIQVDGGRLIFDPGNTTAAGSGNNDVSVASGAELDIKSGTLAIDALDGAGTVLNSSGTGSNTLSLGNNDGGGTFSGVISQVDADAFSVVKNGSGTQILSGANTYNGTTTVNGGELTINNIESGAYTGAIIVNGGTLREVYSYAGDQNTGNTTDYARAASSTTINTGGTLVLDTSSFTNVQSRFDPGAITVNSGGILEIAHNSSNLLVDDFIWRGAASVTGDGTIRKTGAAYADIAWSNPSGTSLDSFDGLIDVDEGTLAVNVRGNSSNGGNAGSGNADLDIASGAVFDVRTGNFQINALDGAGDINNSGGNGGISGILSLGNNDGSGSFSGRILKGHVDGLSLVKNGSGTQILSGASTYTGTTTLGGGVLQVNVADVASTSGALGNGGTITFSGGTLQYGTGISQDYSSRVINSTGSISIDTNGEDVTWASVLDNTNTGGLTKSGAGTLTLGGANTFTGETTVNAGRLVAGSTSAFDNNSSVTVAASAFLALDGNDNSIGSLVGAGDVENASATAATLTTGADNTSTTFSGVLQDGTGGGALSLTKTGGATQTLTGTNTYSGNTTISGGTLEIGSAGQLGSGTYGGMIANSGTFKYNSTANQTLTGVISGTGALTKNNSGTLTLGGASTYTGTTTLGDGVLQATTSGALGNGGTITFSGGTLQYGNGNSQDYSSRVASSTGSISIDTNSENVTWASALDSSNTGGLTKSGAGTLTLDVDNTYTGTTTVSGGTLKVTKQNALGGTAGATTVADGATLELGYAPTVNTAPIEENITLNGAGVNGTEGALKITATGKGNELQSTVTLGSNATINTVARLDHAGTITDNGNDYTLTKTGTGQYRGAFDADFAHLVIAAGEYEVSGDQALPSGTVTVSSGARLDTWADRSLTVAGYTPTITFNDNTSFNIDRNDAVVTIDGAMVLDGNVEFIKTARNGSLTVQSDISGTGALTLKSGNTSTPGTMIFSGNNTYSATTIIGDGAVGAGSMKLYAGSTTGLSNNSDFQVSANSELVLDGSNNSIGSLGDFSGSGGIVQNANATAATLTVGDSDNTTTFSGVIQDGDGGGALSLTKTGAGSQTLSGANTYTGTTTLGGGVLQVNVADVATTSGALGNGGTITFSGGTLQYGTGISQDYSSRVANSTGSISIDTNSENVTWASALDSSNTGGLTKSGAGILTLDGANAFTGNTVVNDGELTINNIESGAYTGAIIVNGGTLREVSAFTGAEQGSNDTDYARSASLTTINSGGTYILDTSSYIDNRSRVDVGTIIVNSGGVLEIAHDSTKLTRDKYIWSGGSVSGDGTIRKTGAAYADVAWNNPSGDSLDSFNGLIDVDEGTLAVNARGNSNNGGVAGSGKADLNIASGAVFDVRSGTFKIDALDGSGAIENSSGLGNTLSIGNDNGGGAFSGNIIQVDPDAFDLVKNGSGTQTLSGANTYTGTTTVNDGTLSLASGASHSGSGAYTVNGGTLKIAHGVDLSGHAMSIAGVISPGNSPGTAATGSQTWLDGGSYLWEINDSDGSKGLTLGGTNGWDWLDITGTLDLSSLTTGGFTIDIDSLTSSNISGAPEGFDIYDSSYTDFDYEFVIATASGGITGFSADKFILDSSGFSALQPEYGWYWDIVEDINNNNLVLQAFAVPEPSSTALLGLGALALAFRRKR